MAARQANSAQSNRAGDTQTMNLELTKQVNGLEEKKKTIAQQYREEAKVSVQGSPMYRPYFGNNMPIQVNGIMVYVPLDGRTYEIPKTFADVFKNRISRIDALIQKQGAMADFIEENSPGEVQLINEA